MNTRRPLRPEPRLRPNPSGVPAINLPPPPPRSATPPTRGRDESDVGDRFPADVRDVGGGVETTRAEAAAESRPVRRKSTGTPRSTVTPGAAVRKTSLSLPASVAQLLREAADSQRKTQLSVILEAVETHKDVVEELVGEEQASGQRRDHEGLFPDPTQRTARVEPQVTTPIRISAANLAVLDEIVVRSGAASRSQLIAAVLRQLP